MANTLVEVPTMAKRTCSIDGCERPHRARGWCAMHYKRFRRNGDPNVVQYIQGDDDRRIWSKVDKDSDGGCWLWTGDIGVQGYGQVWKQGRTRRAHRVVYEMLRGPIPDGLTIDHLCKVRHCVNPSHLEPVTQRENSLRASANYRKTECKAGHPFDDENTYRWRGERRCRECGRIAWRKWNATRRS